MEELCLFLVILNKQLLSWFEEETDASEGDFKGPSKKSLYVCMLE